MTQGEGSMENSRRNKVRVRRLHWEWLEGFRFLGSGGDRNKICECLELEVKERSKTRPDLMLTWGHTEGSSCLCAGGRDLVQSLVL